MYACGLCSVIVIFPWYLHVYFLVSFKMATMTIYIIKPLNKFSKTASTIVLVGWLGEAKVSCILLHQVIQLILAYSWARPAVFAAGKGRGGMFCFFLLILHFHSFSSPLCPSLSSPLLSLLSFFSLSLGDDTK